MNETPSEIGSIFVSGVIVQLDFVIIWKKRAASKMNGSSKATRGEIVKWLNSVLLVNITSIDKAYNGIIIWIFII